MEEVETSEDAISATEVGVLVGVLTETREDVRCLMLPVAIVVKNAKYLSGRQTANRFIVVNVLKK